MQAAGLYLDAPVVDVCSWPGGKGSGRGAGEEWRDCLEVYGVPEDRASGIGAELIGSLDAPASLGLPLLIVTGDADLDVPMAENASVLKREYESRGGSVELIVKPGCAHHSHSLADVRPIVAFAEACAGIATSWFPRIGRIYTTGIEYC